MTFPSLKALRSSGRGESRLNISPVYDFPNFLQVGGSSILILEVVSMLPNIDSQERYESK